MFPSVCQLQVDAGTVLETNAAVEISRIIHSSDNSQTSVHPRVLTSSFPARDNPEQSGFPSLRCLCILLLVWGSDGCRNEREIESPAGINLDLEKESETHIY